MTTPVPKLPEFVLDEFPDEIADFLAKLREMDDAELPHWARVDIAEFHRYLARIGATTKQEGQIRRRSRARHRRATLTAEIPRG